MDCGPIEIVRPVERCCPYRQDGILRLHHKPIDYEAYHRVGRRYYDCGRYRYDGDDDEWYGRRRRRRRRSRERSFRTWDGRSGYDAYSDCDDCSGCDWRRRSEERRRRSHHTIWASYGSDENWITASWDD